MTPEVVGRELYHTRGGCRTDLLEKEVGCLPVVHDNRLKGIITVADLLRVYSGQRNVAWLRGIEIMMQKQVITATPTMSLAEVQRVMRDKHIRHLPVVSGQRLVGMITDRDLREPTVPSHHSDAWRDRLPDGDDTDRDVHDAGRSVGMPWFYDAGRYVCAFGAQDWLPAGR